MSGQTQVGKSDIIRQLFLVQPGNIMYISPLGRLQLSIYRTYNIETDFFPVLQQLRGPQNDIHSLQGQHAAEIENHIFPFCFPGPFRPVGIIDLPIRLQIQYLHLIRIRSQFPAEILSMSSRICHNHIRPAQSPSVSTKKPFPQKRSGRYLFSVEAQRIVHGDEKINIKPAFFQLPSPERNDQLGREPHEHRLILSASGAQKFPEHLHQAQRITFIRKGNHIQLERLFRQQAYFLRIPQIVQILCRNKKNLFSL